MVKGLIVSSGTNFSVGTPEQMGDCDAFIPEEELEVVINPAPKKKTNNHGPRFVISSPEDIDKLRNAGYI